MSHPFRLFATSALALAAFPLGICASPAEAQEGEAGAEENVVVVTGSFIRRGDFESASPIEIIDQSELQAEGVTQATDIIRNLNINVGSRIAFDQANNGRGGVSTFNLRGLGASSTLTLFNGRRVSPRATNANLFPVMAIGRVEVLKDGASALYGADAVAGVVNLISRKVDGFEFDAQYMTSTDLGANTSDTTFSGAWGTGNDTTSVNAFFTYLRRTESFKADPFIATTFNRTIPGFPGTFVTLAPVTTGPLAGRPANFRFVDPACGTVGGTFVLNPGTSNATCVQSVTETLPFISEYDTLSTFVSAEHDITNRLSFRGEFLFSDITDRPSEFVNLTPSGVTSTVPANHPDNVFGVPLRFIGGPGVPQRGFRNQTTQTFRASPSFELELVDNWFLDVGYNYFLERQSNVQRAQNPSSVRLQDALNGVGGQDRNQRFNPFGTALTTPARANAENLLLFITPEQIQITENYYETYDAVLSGKAFQLPGGEVGLAFGVQSRRERLEQDLDPQILGYRGDRPSVSQPPVRQTQNVTAAFVELALPVLPRLEVNFAGRHEDYGAGIGDTQDPKVAVRWTPTDWLTVRGSYGTSFRAPTPAQLDTLVTTRANLPYINPRSAPNCSGTASSFAGGINTGNASLRPETSTNYNFGAQVRNLFGGFRAGVDYYSFVFEDQVARSSGQAIILADCAATNGGPPRDPRITVDSLGNISTVALTLDNLSTIETDGLDFTIGHTFDFGAWGELDVENSTTWMMSYDIQNVPGGPVRDGLGSRNLLANRVSTPEWRSNTTFSWMLGNHTVTAIGRYVSAYDEDLNATTVRRLDAYPTVDLQYAYDLPATLGMRNGPTIAVGAINAFDERPPIVNETVGVDSSVADPRGRMVYIRLRQRL
jgi:iron complex outermembrane receptor protein